MTIQIEMSNARHETDTEDREDRAYELALYLRNRCRGFACLLEAAFEHQTGFDFEEGEGIAQLAKDIAETAGECFELIRAESIARHEANSEGRPHRS